VSRTPNSQTRSSVDATTGATDHLYQDGYSDFQRNGYQTGISMDWSPSKHDNITASATYNHFANNSESLTKIQQDSTGGTSSFSTSSADAGWSAFVTGPKYLSVPFSTSLSAGEYWLAVQHSSTTNTSNSNITMLSFSKLLQQWPVVTVGSLGASVTLASSGPEGMGIGVASAITTNTTMAASVISASTQPLVYFAISNV